MNPFDLLLDQSADRIGWMLVHTVWQGALAAGLLALALRFCKRLSPEARYVISFAALVGLVIAASVTYAFLLPPSGLAVAPAIVSSVDRNTSVPEQVATFTVIQTPTPRNWNPQQAMPWLVAIWAVGVIVITIRQFLGWMMLQHWRRTARKVDDLWNRRFNQLSQTMGTRCIQLAISARVTVPIVVGVWRPIILTPVALFNGLSIEQIEAILAHELAHVRRHDYLANLIQVGIETLLFYHPCVWWISRQIRREREFCCDQVAAKFCGDPAEYAQALASLETLRPAVLAPAAVGDRGELLARVRRLVGGRADEQRTRPAAGAILLIVLCIAGVISGRKLLAQATQPGNGERFGKVVDENNQPLAGARVWQVDNSEDARHPVVITSASTDRLGEFRIPRIGDAANLLVLAPGRAWSNSAIRWSAQDDPSVVHLAPSAKVRLHLLAPDLTPASGVRMRLAGVLAQGRPGGVFLPSGLDDSALMQTTDAQGTCVFDGLPRQGTILVEVADDRFAQIPLNDARITLDDTELTDTVPIRLRPAGTISGKVTYADSGRPIGGVRVFAHTNSRLSSIVVTDDTGKYVVKQLDGATYQVETMLPDQIGLNFAAAAIQNVEVAAGASVQNQNIQLVSGATVRGNILDRDTGKPLPDVAVYVSRMPARPNVRSLVARSGADGVYQLHVIPGDLRLYLLSPLSAGMEPPNPSSYTVNIAENDTAERNFLIATHPTANVTGRTLDDHGLPVSGADILIQKKGDPPPGAVVANSDEKGNFSIPNLETSWRLRARKGTSSTLEHGEFTLDRTYVALVLHANAQSTIRALIRQADGTPIAGATVTLIKGNRSDGETIQRTSGPDGKCIFASLESDFGYQISAYAKGFGIVTLPVTVDGRNQTEAPPIVLPKAESFVAGIVLDVNGAPLVDKRVVLNSGISAPQMVRTDVTGHFRMDGIMAGDQVGVAVPEEDIYGSAASIAAGTDNVIINMRSRN